MKDIICSWLEVLQLHAHNYCSILEAVRATGSRGFSTELNMTVAGLVRKKRTWFNDYSDELLKSKCQSVGLSSLPLLALDADEVFK